MSAVSKFKHFNQVEENLPIEKILEDVQSGKYRDQVEQVRSFLHGGNLEEYERAKKRLPAFTPSGVFHGGRKPEFLQEYSGIVILDLDKLSPEELQQAKENASASAYTYAAFTSPSGNGLKILVKVPGVIRAITAKKELHGGASPGEIHLHNGTNQEIVSAHKRAYNQVKDYYARLLGLKLDESGSDLTRLCFVSYDNELYLNNAADVFPVESVQSPMERQIKPVSSAPAISRSMESNAIKPKVDLVYKHCINLTERKYAYIEGSRNSFVHQLACNLNRYGVEQDEALQCLLVDYNYHEQEVTATIRSAYANVKEFGTKAYPCREGQPAAKSIAHGSETSRKSLSLRNQNYGYSRSEQPPFLDTYSFSREDNDDGSAHPHSKEDAAAGTNIDKIEEFLLDRYEFRYNNVTSRQEYRTSAKGKWLQLGDRAESTMLREMKKAQVRVSQNELRILLNSDFCPLYDPFKAYFKNLPAWDGATDFIHQLASTVTITGQEQWQLCFKKWLVAMVAAVLDPKVVNHTLIVLSGGQGLGKTTWVQNLVPPLLKEYLYSGEINPNNKDTLQQLSENMLINLDELENLNRSEIGSLKEMVTKSEIKVRRAYGHHHEKLIRRASFAGSVNTAQFLNDTTGSRRFLCFEVKDIEYQHQVNLDLVYSQALHLYKSDFRFWFDKEEIKLITSRNEGFQVRAVEEELLLTWFEKPSESTQSLFLTTSQILARLAEKAKLNVNDASANKLGKALRKHGFERLKRRHSYGYQVRELTWEEVDARNRTNPPETPGADSSA